MPASPIDKVYPHPEIHNPIADGKELSLYAATCEELYEKQLEARKQVEEIIFHRQHPTVAEY